jgi:hypothetical protein
MGALEVAWRDFEEDARMRGWLHLLELHSLLFNTPEEKTVDLRELYIRGKEVKVDKQAVLRQDGLHNAAAARRDPAEEGQTRRAEAPARTEEAGDGKQAVAER